MEAGPQSAILHLSSLLLAAGMHRMDLQSCPVVRFGTSYGPPGIRPVAGNLSTISHPPSQVSNPEYEQDFIPGQLHQSSQPSPSTQGCMSSRLPSAEKTLLPAKGKPLSLPPRDDLHRPRELEETVKRRMRKLAGRRRRDVGRGRWTMVMGRSLMTLVKRRLIKRRIRLRKVIALVLSRR